MVAHLKVTLNKADQDIVAHLTEECKAHKQGIFTKEALGSCIIVYQLFPRIVATLSSTRHVRECINIRVKGPLISNDTTRSAHNISCSLLATILFKCITSSV